MKEMWRISPHIRCALDDDGGVILNLRRGRLCCVNPTGAKMLKVLLNSNRSVSEDAIINALREESKIPRNRVEMDVRAFLGSLTEKRIAIRVSRDSHLGNQESVETLNHNQEPRLSGDVHSCKKMEGSHPSPKQALMFGFALVGLIGAKLILATFGFGALHSIVANWPKPRKLRASQSCMCSVVCTNVSKAARWCPQRAWCLEVSAVTVCLLRSYAVPAELVVGYQRMPFAGHAWVEAFGIPINLPMEERNLYRILDRC